MAIDPTLLQLFVGAIGGIGVAVANSRKTITKQKGRTARRRQTTTQRRTGSSRKTASATKVPTIVGTSLSPHQPDIATPAKPAEHHVRRVEDIGHVRSSKALEISVCPSCGLEGTISLLSEHFQSSPFHPYGKQETGAVDSNSEKLPSPPDEHHSMLRNLLSILVPPRAFGRRHLQPESFEGLMHARTRSSTVFGKMLTVDN